MGELPCSGLARSGALAPPREGRVAVHLVRTCVPGGRRGRSLSPLYFGVLGRDLARSPNSINQGKAALLTDGVGASARNAAYGIGCGGRLEPVGSHLEHL